ncbi:Hypothetical protein A7982_11509 [Minicystis rosea]|nr:Hypothetical protein A7982_11509 [Minicystis rosea]
MKPRSIAPLALALAFVLGPVTTRAQAPAPTDLAAILRTAAARQARLEAFERRSSHVETTRTDDLDKNGKVESTSVTVLRVVTKDGKIERTMLKKSRDGKDVEIDAKEKRQVKDRTVELPSPFEAAMQPKHRFTLVGPVPEAPGKVRVRFAAADRVEGASSGEAIVDPVTGDVTWTRFSPAKLPTLVDRISITVDLHAQTTEGLMPSAADVDVDASLLFMKKRMHTHTDYSEYAALP